MDKFLEKTAKHILKFAKDISKNFTYCAIFSLMLEVIMYLSLFALQKSSLIINTLLLITIPMIWCICKEEFEKEEDKLKTYKFVKANVIIGLCLVVNHALYFISTKLMVPKVTANVTTSGQISGILGNGGTATLLNGGSLKIFYLAPLLDLIILFFAIFILRSQDFKQNEEALLAKDFLEKIRNTSGEIENGSIQVCKKADTLVPIRLPYTDRFLHMLIIGPTGCGKTSQIIIPMLNQDVKNLEAGVTVIEPKGDLAEKIYAMAQYYGRKAIYFNPELDACPSFNPLYGKEEDVIENIVTTFKMLDPDAKQYFQDMNEQLLRNGLKVLKRLFKNKATLIDLNTLVANPAGEGRAMVNKFMKLPTKSESESKENLDCATYFLENYFNEKSKTYENCSGIRSQVAKITSNKFLRKVLNPADGKSDLDFEKHLAEGGVLCITTAQGKLRDLGSFLGFFIILNFQSAVFKRPGNENTRRPHFLYIDEFQKYTNPGFADMLTQGRSYRVASHLATQARAQIGMGAGKDGNAFINLVSTNCRNVVVFPGVSYDDAKFYSDQFGQDMNKKVKISRSQKEFNPIYGFEKVGYANISQSTDEKLEARFTPTDIIYRKKGEMTFSWVDHMVVQTPVSGKIEYIPYEINKRLDEMIVENEYLMRYGQDPNECRLIGEPDAPLKPEWAEKYNEIVAFVDKKLADEYSMEEDEVKQENKNEIGDILDDNLKGLNPLDMVQIMDNPTDGRKPKGNFNSSEGILVDEDDNKPSGSDSPITIPDDGDIDMA